MSVSVVGFDIGNETSYIAVAKGGGIETIANEYSDRCTPTYVSFGDKSRFMGASAKQQAITNIKNTVFNFPRLIGKNFSDPAVQREIPFLPYDIVKLENDKIGIQCQYLNETTTFSPEQIMATQLTKLKEITETHLQASCIDVVVNVPAYYTDSERRAMLDASYIAGLNCVRLVNDTTACAIAYGLYNKDFPPVDAPPKIVAFVMMGQSNLQVAICAFNNAKVKMLAVSSDANLGGRDFDRAIFRHMCAEIETSYKLKVTSNKKASVRLLQECEKLKKLMSANSTQIPLNIECFMEDKDISLRMQRSEFEGVITDDLTRLEQTLLDCISMAKLAVKDISLVELVGGSTRVPAVKSIVQKVFGQEGRTTLNSDEAVARGCALQAAICSPAFKVRDFSITDLTPYGISLSVLGGTEPYVTEIFPQMHNIPSSRQIEIKRSQDFEIQAYYTDSSKLPTQTSDIAKFSVRDVKLVNGAEPKVLLKIRMNRHGIFNLSQAQLAEPYQKEVEEEMTPEEMKAAGINPETPMEVDEKSEEDVAAEKPEANGVEKEKAKTKKVTIPKKKVIKTFIKYIDLPVDVLFMPQLTSSELNKYKESECEMISQDHLERERSNAKNALEEYIYEMRDKLAGPLEPYVLECDREAFSAKLTELEDWLYDEGEDLPKQPYIDKLKGLKSVGDAYVVRLREAEMRPSAFERLARSLNHVEKALQSYANGDEELNHLTPEDMDLVEKNFQETRQWYDEQMSALTALKLCENPPVYVSEIDVKTASFVAATNPILTKKKPEVKPPPPPQQKETNGHTDQNAQDGDPNCENNNSHPDDLKSKGKTADQNTADMDLD